MFKIVGCFVGEHDLRLVLLAACVCTLSAFTVVALLFHSRQFTGALRALWLTIAALAFSSWRSQRTEAPAALGVNVEPSE